MFRSFTNSPIKISLARHHRGASILAGTGPQNHVKLLPLEGCNDLIRDHNLLDCGSILRPRHPKRVLAPDMVEPELARLVGFCLICNLVVSNERDLNIRHWTPDRIHNVTVNMAQTLRSWHIDLCT